MKNILSVLLLFNFVVVKAQITLTHNIGTVPINTGMPNCDYEENWGRVFNLSDFGIKNDEQFIIKSGEVAISNSYDGARVGLSIFSVDSEFPNSSPAFIGGGTTLIHEIGDNPEIIQIEFYAEVVIPSSVKRILVVASQSEDIYNPDYKKVSIAGTQDDNGVSWFYGCREYYKYTPTTDLAVPVPNANFYINVTGETFNILNTDENITLTHNLDDPPVKINQYGCTGGGLKFGRTFDLKDFGIEMNEEFVISNGQVAFSSVSVWDVKIQFNIYKIDENFPESFSAQNLLGSSQIVDIPYFGTGNPSRIFTVKFDDPVVVPSNVKRVLVEVYNLARPGYSSIVFIAGTKVYTGLSWLKSEAGGCPPECYTSTKDMGRSELNYYVNVSGDVNEVSNTFGISVTNVCSGFLKKFSIEDKSNVDSVHWDFGDASSGVNNSSSDLTPSHEFSGIGQYSVSATVRGKDGKVEDLTETVIVNSPIAFSVSDIYACEDDYNSGFSSSFDLSNIEKQVLGGQFDRIVSFFDEDGSQIYDFSSPFSNVKKDMQTITIRVSDSGNRCCYSETTFDLIVKPLPRLSAIENIYECENDSGGFTVFNLSGTYLKLEQEFPNAIIEFFHQDGTSISTLSVQNKIVKQEEIKVKVTPENISCYNEITFDIVVTQKPEVNMLSEILGCDDDGDGISEYFDTSDIENELLKGKVGMVVSYYDEQGSLLPSPLPNPYTNSIPNQETILVRVMDVLTKCYNETSLILKTSNKPKVNRPSDKYACNEGAGFGSFNMSTVEREIIGEQSNLNVYFYNELGIELVDFTMSDFKNTQVWKQTINVKVENSSSNLCFSETSFDLIVNNSPEVNLESSYFLCNLEPSLYISVDSAMSTYVWEYQDGSVISRLHDVSLVDSGNYTLTVGEDINGVYCENKFNFDMIRSVLPKITNVNFKELTDNNSIEIEASGDGDFEYSIDGFNYQKSNLFENVQGGVYNVSVRDELGCGEDFTEVTILDYPKYFTPNNDGKHDYWKVEGLEKYADATILIYDRYGKLIKQLNASSLGWDGLYGGQKMPDSDYWFIVDMGAKDQIIGHFALKR